MSPSETTCENPIPRGAAQSSMAVTRAPDWLTSAISPAGGERCEKLASSPIRGTMMPRQWSDEAQQVRLCRLETLLLQGASVFAELAETAGNDDGAAGAQRAELGNQGRHGLRRRRNDREIGRPRQAADARIDREAVDGPVARVHQHQLAAETGSPQVAEDQRADRTGPRRGADQSGRTRGEDLAEVADRHCRSPTSASPNRPLGELIAINAEGPADLSEATGRTAS